MAVCTGCRGKACRTAVFPARQIKTTYVAPPFSSPSLPLCLVQEAVAGFPCFVEVYPKEGQMVGGGCPPPRMLPPSRCLMLQSTVMDI